MFADSELELHAMARRIGLLRGWFQDHHANPALWHYDVTPPKRAWAISLGAIEVDTKEYLQRVLRESNP